MVRRDLVRALHKKRPQLDYDRVIYHQDNAPSHTAAATILDINLLGFEILKHPAYSPDLAPMDFRVFPELKQQLRGTKFDSVEELVKSTQSIVSTFDEKWYKDTYTKWVQRHRKCVELNGGYLEKE